MKPPKSSKKTLYLDLGVVTLLVAVGIGLRLYWGLSDDSIFHPDAIYQVLEPAHRLVYGYGLEAWEWEMGARNWALPGMLGAVIGAARLVGLDQPEGYLGVVRIFVATIFCASAYPVYFLARRFGAARALALAAAALFLLNPAMIALGYRTLSEVISTPFVLFGLMWALGAGASGTESNNTPKKLDKRARFWLVIGVSLLGIAVLFRLQNALFALAVVLPWRFQQGQEERYKLALRVLLGWALVYGLIDLFTWGIPFASAGAYIRFNLVLGGSTEFLGANPAFYYVQLFYRSMGLAGVMLLGLPLLAISRARVVFLCAFLYLGAHSFFPHKELRFVITTVPILAVLSAVGVQWAVERVGSKRLQTALAIGGAGAIFLAACPGPWRVEGLKMGDVGAPELAHTTANTRIFDHLGELNRLLIRASERDDICGLYLREYASVETGGHSYFHREIPFYNPSNPPAEKSDFNYVISTQKPSPQWKVIDANKAFVLYKSQSKTCTRTKDYKALLIAP